jgi:ElaB/YqjD/DUF883 family membrane-anchored ribosome-binding protein
MSKKKSQQKELVNQNPWEAMGYVAGGIGDATVDAAKEGFSDFWKQILGGGGSNGHESGGHHAPAHHGDLAEGQELDLSNHKQEKSHNADIEPGIDYHREIVHTESRAQKREVSEIEQKIQQIIYELQRLTASSEVLKQEFKEVTTDTHIVNPGKYHLSFFEWMLVCGTTGTHESRRLRRVACNHERQKRQTRLLGYV